LRWPGTVSNRTLLGFVGTTGYRMSIVMFETTRAVPSG
jgi:hypothetical protein